MSLRIGLPLQSTLKTIVNLHAERLGHSADGDGASGGNATAEVDGGVDDFFGRVEGEEEAVGGRFFCRDEFAGEEQTRSGLRADEGRENVL